MIIEWKFVTYRSWGTDVTIIRLVAVVEKQVTITIGTIDNYY